MNRRVAILTGGLYDKPPGTFVRDGPPTIDSQRELEKALRTTDPTELRSIAEALKGERTGPVWKKLEKLIGANLKWGSGPTDQQLNHNNARGLLLRVTESLTLARGVVLPRVAAGPMATFSETTTMASNNIPVQQAGESFEAYRLRLSLTQGKTIDEALALTGGPSVHSGGGGGGFKKFGMKVLSGASSAGGRLAAATTVVVMFFLGWAVYQANWVIEPSNLHESANRLWSGHPWTVAVLGLLWLVFGTVAYKPTVKYGGGLLFLALYPLSAILWLVKQYAFPATKFVVLYGLDRADALLNGYFGMQANLWPKLGIPKVGYFGAIAKTDPMAKVTAATWAPRSTIGRAPDPILTGSNVTITKA